MNILPFKVIGIATVMSMLALAGCEDEGPAEKFGENVDEAVEEAGDAAEEAADELEQKTDN